MGIVNVAVVIALLLAVGAAVLVAARGRRVPGRAARPRPTRETRLVRRTRLAGLGLGLVAAAIVWSSGDYGRGPMLAPAVFGLCVVLAAVLGETVIRPRRTPGPRSASLTPRRLGDYLPGALTGVVGAVAALTVALLAFTTATATREELTGARRALSCETERVGANYTPYPGSFYSVPLALVLVVVLLVAALASRQAILRPRGLAADDDGDDLLRRRSVEVIVCAVGVAVCAPYVGLALTAGAALQGLGDSRPSCAPGWMQPVGAVVSWSAALALVLFGVCLIRLVVGSGVVAPATREGAPA